MGTHSGPMEHNHIEKVKKNYKNSQKNKLTLDSSLGKHLTEGYLIDFAYNKIQAMRQEETNQASDKKFTGFPKNATRFKVIRYTESEDRAEGWHIASPKPMTNDERYVPLFLGVFTTTHGSEPWFFETEYVRDGVIFRGNEDYRSDGAWRDWVMIQFERTPTDNKQNKQDAKSNRIAFGMDSENYDD